MFEDTEVGENMGKSSAWRMELVSFVAGMAVAIVLAYLVLIPSAKRAAARAGEQAAQQRFAAEPMAVELQKVKADLQSAAQDRDACKDKFERQTILYDDSVLIDPGKEWIIPADIVPIILTNRSVSFTHYDPKEKRESAHFRPTKQEGLDAPK